MILIDDLFGPLKKEVCKTAKEIYTFVKLLCKIVKMRKKYGKTFEFVKRTTRSIV